MVDSILQEDVTGCNQVVEGEATLFSLPLSRRGRHDRYTGWIRTTIDATGKKNYWGSCGEENGYAILLCNSCVKRLGIEW